MQQRATLGTAVALAGALALSAQIAFAVQEPRPIDPENTISCTDPRDPSMRYDPVCPAGYFKCCSTCSSSPCYGSSKMYLSWRGLPECIECAPGDYCPGCDVFERCPNSTQENRQGKKISKPKSTGFGDCESCPPGLEASFDQSACMAKYTHVCSVEAVGRCIRSCKAGDPSLGKEMDGCDRMKCTMFCAKRWSLDCRDAVQQYCIFSTTLALDLPEGLEPEEGQGAIVGCDVDCSAAPPEAARWSAFLVAAISALLSATSC